MFCSSYFRLCTCLGLLYATALLLPNVQGGSATWKTAPTDGSWSNTANWSPATVPQASDTATFNNSSITTISETLGFGSLGAYQFNAGASAYTINYYPAFTFQINGTGVTNNSGMLQNFSVPPSNQFREPINTVVSFQNSATAGSLTQWTVKGSAVGAYYEGQLLFNGTSSASGATIMVTPGGSDIGGEDGDGFGGVLDFLGSSTASSANITALGGPAGADFGSAPSITFENNATAARRRSWATAARSVTLSGRRSSFSTRPRLRQLRSPTTRAP
ncbi:MAG: hypothetical protein ACR2II_05005 [Chthoniobacterales bacterium]